MVQMSSRDHEAGRLLTSLYREHAQGAYRYAFHLTRSREDADDLVQLAFLELHRSIVRGEEIATPSAWLATVIKRRAINLFQARREDPASDRLEYDHAAPTEDSRQEAAAQLAQVQSVLYTLPETQHHAFVLRHWSGLSSRELAAVLKTSESAVESLLARARTAVIAAGDSTEPCAAVCAQLAAERPLSERERAHLDGCRRCRTAQKRLTRAVGVAAAALLAPSLHTTNALAAAVPGFSATVAAGGSGAAGAGVGAAAGTKAGIVTLLAKTAVATVAVTAAALTIHTQLHHVVQSRRAANPHFATLAVRSTSHGQHSPGASQHSSPEAPPTSHPTSHPTHAASSRLR
ncbi:MAG: sigma-70 family RNA polymerase sigma factor [Gaiellaceae bacterium]